MQGLFWQLMTDQEYQKLEKLIEDSIGVKLSHNRKDFVENLLIKKFKMLDISDFNTYYERINNDEQEMACLINSLTNTSTDFFRENHHFEYMANHILPELIASKEKIRLWSAGCSTGEEPYSMAITLYETVPDLEKLDIKILATDINTEALEFAQAGIYDQVHSKKLGNHKKSYHIVQDINHKKIQMKDFLKKIIAFRKLNLLEPWPMKNPFDVIFCRNVTIYLRPEITAHIFQRFDQLLKVGGFLILGHSENLTLFQDRYVCLGQTIYKKVG